MEFCVAGPFELTGVSRLALSLAMWHHLETEQPTTNKQNKGFTTVTNDPGGIC